VEDPTYQCGFCGTAIEKSPTDPVFLGISLPNGGNQAIFAHLACLRRVIHPSVPLALFETDDESE
jgi:hypothetical protein